MKQTNSPAPPSPNKPDRQLYTFLFPLTLGLAIGLFVRDFWPSPKLPVSAEQTASESDQEQPQHVSKRGIANAPPVLKGPIQSQTPRVADIQAGMQHLKDIPDLEERKARFAELIRAWLETDGRGAFAYILSMNEGALRQKGMALAAEVLAHSDPQFLAQQALLLPGSRSRGELVRGLANAWSSMDIPSALAWAAKLSDGVDKNDALFTIRSQWASQDPEGASAQISQLPENSSTATLVTTIASKWAATNPSKAIEWANKLPEDQKTLAMSRVAAIWAERDPNAAGNYVAQMPEGQTQDEAVKAVISSWASKNPAQTAAWVLQFPSGPLQEQALRQVVSAWNDLDPQAGQTWALNLASGPARDAALKNFAESSAYWMPEKAARLVPYITDPSEQEKSIETVMRSWLEIDPKSAKTWFSGLKVSNDLQTRVQSFLPAN